MSKHARVWINTILFLCVSFYCPLILLSQTPQKSFDTQLPEIYFTPLSEQFGKNKKIPAAYRKSILIALSYYPELRNTLLRFRIKNRHSPLMTIPSFFSHFKNNAGRKFVIIISDKSNQMLEPVLFKNLNFNAQIGVIGHELAHVSDFSSYNFMQMIKHVISNLSKKYLDRFEFKTDSICIAHGLGYQLLAWSVQVRTKMNAGNWRGADNGHNSQTRERYMNPETILKRMENQPLYQSVSSPQ